MGEEGIMECKNRQAFVNSFVLYIYLYKICIFYVTISKIKLKIQFPKNRRKILNLFKLMSRQYDQTENTTKTLKAVLQLHIPEEIHIMEKKMISKHIKY